MKIVLSEQAVDFLTKLKNQKMAAQISAAIDELSHHGNAAAQVKKLTGVSNGYRKRVGRYRILYTVEKEKLFRIWIIAMEKDTKKDYRRWIEYILERL